MSVNAKRSSTKVKTTTYHFLFYFCSKNPDRASGFANISILVSKRQFLLFFCIGTSQNTLARTIMIASANDVCRQKAWDRNFKGSDKSRTSGYISILWPRFEPRASGVVLQCTNHYTNHVITILMCKLRYIHITSTIQQQSYFSK